MVINYVRKLRQNNYKTGDWFILENEQLRYLCVLAQLEEDVVNLLSFSKEKCNRFTSAIKVKSASNITEEELRQLAKSFNYEKVEVEINVDYDNKIN